MNSRPESKPDAPNPAIAFLNLLDEDKQIITYRPMLAKLAGGVLPAIFLQQALHYWKLNNRKPFYKFNAPCEKHKLYREGDSWQETLFFSRAELDTALAAVATKISKGMSKSDAMLPQDQEGNWKAASSFILYWIDSNRVTWYWINEDLLGNVLIQHYLKNDLGPHYLGKPKRPISLHAESSSEIHAERGESRTDARESLPPLSQNREEPPYEHVKMEPPLAEDESPADPFHPSPAETRLALRILCRKVNSRLSETSAAHLDEAMRGIRAAEPTHADLEAFTAWVQNDYWPQTTLHFSQLLPAWAEWTPIRDAERTAQSEALAKQVAIEAARLRQLAENEEMRREGEEAARLYRETLAANPPPNAPKTEEELLRESEQELYRRQRECLRRYEVTNSEIDRLLAEQHPLPEAEWCILLKKQAREFILRRFPDTVLPGASA